LIEVKISDGQVSEGGNLMLELIIVVLVVLWLLGFLGPRFMPSFPRTGNVVHVLLIIALIIIVLRLLGQV